MESLEILYVNNLIFSYLAKHKSVHIDGVGSLECLLHSTTKNYTENINEAPKYEIIFSFEQTGDSVSKLIADNTNCAPKEAKELFSEWLDSVKTGDDKFVCYVIKRVGVIDVQLNVNGKFKCDNELLEYLEPVKIRDVKATIIKDISIESTRTTIKNNKLKSVVIFLSVFAIAVISYVVVSMLLFSDVNVNSITTTNVSNNVEVDLLKETNITPISVDTTNIDVETINNVKKDLLVDKLPDSVGETLNKADIEPNKISYSTPKKGYYVVVNTFIKKENAQKRVRQLANIEKNIEILEIPNHNRTPYFVVIDRYDDLVSARARMNSSNLDSVWVFSF